jgi:hypothetical protein
MRLPSLADGDPGGLAPARVLATVRAASWRSREQP